MSITFLSNPPSDYLFVLSNPCSNTSDNYNIFNLNFIPNENNKINVVQNNPELNHRIDIISVINNNTPKFEEVKQTEDITKVEENNNIFLNQKRKPGRKNDSKSIKVHDKMSTDNILSKIKGIVTESAYDCINGELSKIYPIDNTKKKKSYENQLIKIKYEIVRNTKLEEIKNYSQKTLKDIFLSEKSDKFKKYNDDHNKDLMEKSLEDSQGEVRENLEKLYNMKFIDYLDIYCEKNTEHNLKLVTLKTFNNLCDEEQFESEYKEKLNYYLLNYREILKNIQIRRAKQYKLLKENNM